MKSARGVGRCPTPTKRRYRTAETARNAIARINAARGLTGTDGEQEPYECSCGHFHGRTIAKQWWRKQLPVKQRRGKQLPAIYDARAAGWPHLRQGGSA